MWAATFCSTETAVENAGPGRSLPKYTSFYMKSRRFPGLSSLWTTPMMHCSFSSQGAAELQPFSVHSPVDVARRGECFPLGTRHEGEIGSRWNRKWRAETKTGFVPDRDVARVWTQITQTHPRPLMHADKLSCLNIKRKVSPSPPSLRSSPPSLPPSSTCSLLSVHFNPRPFHPPRALLHISLSRPGGCNTRGHILITYHKQNFTVIAVVVVVLVVFEVLQSTKTK